MNGVTKFQDNLDRYSYEQMSLNLVNIITEMECFWISILENRILKVDYIREMTYISTLLAIWKSSSGLSYIPSINSCGLPITVVQVNNYAATESHSPNSTLNGSSNVLTVSAPSELATSDLHPCWPELHRDPRRTVHRDCLSYTGPGHYVQEAGLVELGASAVYLDPRPCLFTDAPRVCVSPPRESEQVRGHDFLCGLNYIKRAVVAVIEGGPAAGSWSRDKRRKTRDRRAEALR